jgi:hypothetical protein
MPRPAYIMFAASGAVDRHTNRSSYFDIIETIEVVLAEAGSGAPALASQQPMRIAAVWMREETESTEDRYEGQIACIAPDGTEFFATPVALFTIPLLFYRIDIPNVIIPGFPALGLYVIEGRLRRAGQQGWELRQSFPFHVREMPAPTPRATPPVEPPPAAPEG